jgi:hypothetical protein
MLGCDGSQSDDARFPTDTCAYAKGFPVRLQLDNLGKIGPEGISCEAASLRQDFIKVIGSESKFPKSSECRLLTEKFL